VPSGGRGSAGSGRRATGKLSSTRTNRRLWEKTSDAYERRHYRDLRVSGGESWGLYRIPEDRLRLLDPVKGREVLELGCGAAIWSIALARRGASVVGLDLSRGHLRHAVRNARQARVRVALLEANAERLPFRSSRFDLAFCDWGAFFFADPARTIPEAARVLRSGGQLVFATGHPLRAVVQSRRSGSMLRRLTYDYFGLGGVRMVDGIEFYRTFGDWIELFRSHGLRVERLLEPRAPAGRRSGYLSAKDQRWGGRWPLEVIWVLRKGDTPAATGRGITRNRRRRPIGST
jgi:SAM-dependent methyltransferase